MGVTSFSDEMVSQVAPARLFKALVTDSVALVPKLFPDVIKSVDIVSGDGGAGTVVQINFASEKVAKHRFETVDKVNFICKYTLIEGEELKDGVESITYVNTFEATSDGGSKCKRTVQVHAAEGATFKEDDIKASNEKSEKIFKAIEAYLVENPTA